MAEPPLLTREPIDVATLIEFASAAGCGGTTVFVGTVRASDEDGPVARIEYSAYDEMAERELRAILKEASDQWAGLRAIAQHRLGMVGLGEASIAVVAATPHRSASFEACRYVIEQVKVRLPVWKREYMSDGSERWRENQPPVE